MRRAIGYIADLLVVVLAVAALAIYAKKQNLFHTSSPTPREAFFKIGRPRFLMRSPWRKTNISRHRGGSGLMTPNVKT